MAAHLRVDTGRSSASSYGGGDFGDESHPLPTPSTGPDICINCLDFSAFLAGQYRKKRHVGTLKVVGLDPEGYMSTVTPEWEGVSWTLMIWRCRHCASEWASYYFYKDIYDGRISDPVNNPVELMKRRASQTSVSSSSQASTGSATGIWQEGHTPNEPLYPVIPSNRLPSSTRSDAFSAHYLTHVPIDASYAPVQQDHWQTPHVPATILSPVSEPRMLENESPLHQVRPARIVRRRSARERSISAVSSYQSDSDHGAHSAKEASVSGTRTSLTPQMEFRGRSITPVSLDAFHRRGSNFRLDNYGRIRQLGACSKCRARKKQCSPSHHQRQLQETEEG